MSFVASFNRVVTDSITTEAILCAGAIAMDNAIRYWNPQNRIIMRIASSMLYANTGVALLINYKLLESMTGRVWATANLVAVVGLGILAWIKPTKAVSKPLAPEIPRTFVEMRCPQGLKVPRHANAALESLTPGKSTVLNLSKGWDENAFAWALTNHEKFKNSKCYFYQGTNAQELQRFLTQSSPHVLITFFKQEGLKIPSGTYVIQLERKPTAASAFSAMSLEEFKALYVEYSKTGEFQRMFSPRFTFEEGAIEALCEIVWRGSMDCSIYSLIHKLDRFLGNGVYTIKKSSINPAKLELVVPQSLAEAGIIDQHINFNRHVGLALFHSDKPLIEEPPFLKRLQGGHRVRGGQAGQVTRALGAQMHPHAAVVGFNAEEMGEVLSSVEGREVFQLDWTQMDKGWDVVLTDFLVYHKGPIIYLSGLDSLLLSDTLLPLLLSIVEKAGACVVGCIKTPLLADTNFQRNLERFKQVHLIPLKQPECLEAAKAWAADYEFEDKALEIAVEAVFLLRGGKGTELRLIKDLLERAVNKENSQVTVANVWDVFKELHYTEVKMHEQSVNPQLKGLVEPRSVMSLLRISLALKKKYDVILPIEKIDVVHPPEFLTDLNEQLKGQDLFAKPIESRLEDLADALTGQYHNALILGESGSGKTTLVKTAAWLSANGKLRAEHPLYGKTIYTMSLSEFMAGSKWVGTLEERVTKLFNFLIQNKNAVLFVDEIHLAMGSGATHGNEMGTVGQHFKTYLEESGVMVIGATTIREYNQWVSRDAAFARRFNEMKLPDPSEKEILEIFNFYIATEGYKKLCPSLVLSTENIQYVYSIVAKQRSDISAIDRGKKLLEAVAKKAKKDSRTTVDEAFISRL